MTQEAKKEVPNLNGLETRVIRQTIFVPLPRELWRPCGGCCCAYCSADGKMSEAGMWDTLAISAKGGCTWTVHMPELHGARPLRSETDRDSVFRTLSAG